MNPQTLIDQIKVRRVDEPDGGVTLYAGFKVTAEHRLTARFLSTQKPPPEVIIDQASKDMVKGIEDSIYGEVRKTVHRLVTELEQLVDPSWFKGIAVMGAFNDKLEELRNFDSGPKSGGGCPSA